MPAMAVTSLPQQGAAATDELFNLRRVLARLLARSTTLALTLGSGRWWPASSLSTASIC